MTKYLKLLLGCGLVALALVGAWAVLGPGMGPGTGPADGAVAASDVGGSGMLDGMTFTGTMRLPSDTDDVEDTFVFANGTFFSTECDRRCGYPARPYYVRHVGEKIEFFSESRCLHKDAKIVWHGTVENGTIRGVSDWTLRRWYWTIEKRFVFEGTLTKPAGPVASTQ